MDRNENSSWKPWAITLAVLAAVVAAFMVLYRMERRLRAFCKRTENSLRVKTSPMTIELEEEA